MNRTTRRTGRRAARGTKALACALTLWLGACQDGVSVDEDWCSGRLGDPSIPTSCVILEGRVLDSIGGVPVGGVNVTVDCFGPETYGCGSTPVETNDQGLYRTMVHDMRTEGGPGSIVLRAVHRFTDRRVVSDTVNVLFGAMGGPAPVYGIELTLPEN